MSRHTAGAAWPVRMWQFGVADILAILLVAALGVPKVASQLLSDAGTGWHIRLGEGILRTQTLPYTDTFSQIGLDRPWIDWSWIADIAWALCMRYGGLHAVCMLTIAAEALFIAVLWRLVSKRCHNVCVCLLLCVAVVGLSFVHLLARPHIWAWTLCLLVYDTLDARPEARDWHPAELLLLFVLWVNMHPSFAFGLGLAVLMLAAQWLQGRLNPYPQAHLGASRTALLVLGLVAVSLCNPYGTGLHTQMFNLLSRAELLAVIDEYRSLNVHTALGGVYVSMVLVGLWALGRVPQPLWRVWTFALAAYVGLLAQRNIPFGAALMAVTMAESLDALWSQWRAVKRPSHLRRLLGFAGTFAQNPNDRHVHIWVWLVLAGLFLTGRQMGMTELYDMPKRVQLAPFTQTLLQYGVTGGVLCDVQRGGALGFASQGRIRPVLDDRFELATDNEIMALQNALAGLHNWQLYLTQYKIDWALLDADTALGELLATTPHWHVAQVHAGLVLWHRDLTLGR